MQRSHWLSQPFWCGNFPELDLNGDPWDVADRHAAVGGHSLCPGLNLFGSSWVIKGDMNWLANALNLSHSSAHIMCPWCMANDIEPAEQELIDRDGTESIPWNDISRDAVWRSTTWQSADHWYLAHGGRHSCHPLLSVPGASGLCVMADAMHIMDLGFTHHCLGNTLFHMCWMGPLLWSRAESTEAIGYMLG